MMMTMMVMMILMICKAMLSVMHIALDPRLFLLLVDLPLQLKPDLLQGVTILVTPSQELRKLKLWRGK